MEHKINLSSIRSWGRVAMLALGVFFNSTQFAEGARSHSVEENPPQQHSYSLPNINPATEQETENQQFKKFLESYTLATSAFKEMQEHLIQIEKINSYCAEQWSNRQATSTNELTQLTINKESTRKLRADLKKFLSENSQESILYAIRHKPKSKQIEAMISVNSGLAQLSNSFKNDSTATCAVLYMSR